jgi:hypothetical protein
MVISLRSSLVDIGSRVAGRGSWVAQRCVILSEAKDLLARFGKLAGKIPRCARNDISLRSE